MATMATPSTVGKFIPEVWSARLKSNLNKNLVFGDSVNRDYEGEISGRGDTVHVQNIGRIALTAYDRNGTLAAPATLTDGQTTLTVTEANAFNFKVDDIDKAQTQGNLMEEAMKEAGYSLKDAVDQYIAGMYTDCTAGSALADLNGVNKDKFYDLLVGNRQKFREMNVPIDELSVVIPPWLESLVLLDSRLIHATAAGDSLLRSGEIGRLAGFTLRVSNNVHKVTTTQDDYHIMSFAGKQGISMADQINKVEAYRPELMFADAVKGLHVFGAKVMRPEFVIYNTVSE